MNVTGIEWRDLDSRERSFPSRRAPRSAPKPAASGDDDDIVEIHGQADEETADESE